MPDPSPEQSSKTRPPATPTWEKVVGFAGFLLLCAGFIYLGRAAVTENDAPPEIRFKVEEIKTLQTGWLVKVEVKNTGFESVAALQMEGRLVAKNEEPEINVIQADYVPSQSSRKVGFFFRNNPEEGALGFRAMGYQEP